MGEQEKREPFDGEAYALRRLLDDIRRARAKLEAIERAVDALDWHDVEQVGLSLISDAGHVIAEAAVLEAADCVRRGVFLPFGEKR